MIQALKQFGKHKIFRGFAGSDMNNLYICDASTDEYSTIKNITKRRSIHDS